MNKKGFTLMELLLVVAVLAIVAAAAAPTFFGGATEAMNEAKKSNMMAAYQNTISGANIMLGIASSKGVTLSGSLEAPTSSDSDLYSGSLASYTPVVSRVFKDKAGKYHVFSAKAESNTVVVTYSAAADSAPTAATGATTEVGDTTYDAAATAKALDTLWESDFAASN